MDYMKIYQQWCSDPYFDDATKAELKAIENDQRRDRRQILPSVRIWNRRTAWSDRSRNKSHEHLYRASGNTGTCKLCH